MIKIASILTAVLALAAAVPAQLIPVTLSGKVVKAPASPCNSKATHAIECSDILLQTKSPTVDLSKFEGKVVDISGKLVIGLGCQSIDVESIENAAMQTSTVALFGTKLGKTVLMTTTAPLGTLVPIIFAPKPGFLPLGPLGSYMLDFSTSVYISMDPSIGVAVHREVVPNNPSLIGAVIYYQTMALQVLPQLAVRILNPNCFTITR